MCRRRGKAKQVLYVPILQMLINAEPLLHDFSVCVESNASSYQIEQTIIDLIILSLEIM